MIMFWLRKKQNKKEANRGLSGKAGDHFGATNGVKMLNPITKCTPQKMSTSLKNVV